MTYVDADTAIVNRALQVIGTRTTVTTAEMNALSSNEAIQVNLIFTAYRDQLLRMAPWNCALVYANLAYLTSVPGTPENTSPATTLWTSGQPAPPWAYEYFYPDDCLRDCFVIPANQTGFAGNIPITTAVTGGAPAFWAGQPIRFKVALDRYFRQATGTVTIVTPGSGYAVGDTVVFGGAPSVSGDVPSGIINAVVATLSGSGIATATLQNFTNLGKNSLLFGVPAHSMNQVSTSGLGTGAVASIAAVSAAAFSARTVLTNQEYATMAYCQQVTDSNVMDPDFKEAWAEVLGAGVCIALSGDKALANLCIGRANKKIEEARKTDGNEGLTINDVTPDFLRIRGIAMTESYSGPWSGFDWGNLWATF
jgi:hypothetical protein